MVAADGGAWPSVDPECGLPELRDRLVDESGEQRRHVVAALAQRRHAEPHDVQPVEEIGAEPPAATIAPDRPWSSATTRRSTPRAGRRRSAWTSRSSSTRSNLRLHRQRHAVDLVEQQRAAARRRDLADPRDSRVCGTLSAAWPNNSISAIASGSAPQLTAIERPAAPRALPVEQRRDQLLAGAGLALDQHVDIGLGELADRVAQPQPSPGCRRSADCRSPRPSAARAAGDCRAPAARFSSARAPRRRDDRWRTAWSGNRTRRRAARRTAIGDVAMAGDQDDGNFGVDRADRGEAAASPSIRGMRMSETTTPAKSASIARERASALARRPRRSSPASSSACTVAIAQLRRRPRRRDDLRSANSSCALQREREGGAAERRCVELELAAEFARDVARDGEAEAEAVGLADDEGREQLVGDRRVDARAIVDDRRRRPRLGAWRRSGSRGAALPSTASSAFWRRLMRTCSSRTRSPANATSAHAAGDGRRDDAARALADQQQRAVEHRARASTAPPAGVPRRAKPRSSPVIVPIRAVSSTMRPRFSRGRLGCAAVDEGRAVFGEGADRGDRLVDLVRDAGGDLAERCQPVGLGEFFARRAVAAVGFARVRRDSIDQPRVGVAQLGGAAHDFALRARAAPRACSRRVLGRARQPGQRRARATSNSAEPDSSACAVAAASGLIERRYEMEQRARRRAARARPPRDSARRCRRSSRRAAPSSDERRRRGRHCCRTAACGAICASVAASSGAMARNRQSRHAGDQDHAVRVGDEARPRRCAPRPPRAASNSTLTTTTPSARPPRSTRRAKNRPGPAADRAEREQLGRAVAHRVAEIGAEAVILADEAGRQAPVARRDGRAVAIDDIDRRGVGALGEQFERGVEPRRAAGAVACSAVATSGYSASTSGSSRNFCSSLASRPAWVRAVCVAASRHRRARVRPAQRPAADPNSASAAISAIAAIAKGRPSGHQRATRRIMGGYRTICAPCVRKSAQSRRAPFATRCKENLAYIQMLMSS